MQNMAEFKILRKLRAWKSYFSYGH